MSKKPSYTDLVQRVKELEQERCLDGPFADEIAERKEMEQELRESEEKFRAMIETLPLAVYLTSRVEKISEYMNPFFINQFGYTLEEVPRVADWFELVYPDPVYREKVLTEWNERVQRAIETQTRSEPIETVVTCKNGSEKSVLWGYVCIGEKNYVYGVDITERKLAEAQKDRLTAAVEQSAEGIVITDAEGVIEYVNPSFERITGYSRADALGSTPRLLKSGQQDEAFYADLWRTITSGKIWRGQMVNRRKDGGVYTESNVISSVKDSGGNIVNFVSVKTDISQELLREEKSRQAMKMEAIGQLAGGIAHDFNNQLSGILGYSEILIDSLKDEQQLRDATLIKEGALRAADLTAQLLAFSHKGKALSAPVNIHKLIAEVADILEHSIDKQITIRQTLDADPETTLGDPSQLQNALLNMAINARDAMPDGGNLIFETGVTELDAAFFQGHPMEGHPGTYLMISISDNGCGMDAETQKHIFEPFYTTKEVGEGTGMGLASVYGTIHNHKGFINVYSEVGHGTTFRIYLPLIEAAFPQESTNNSKPITGTARILLVDDEEMVRKIGTRVLGKLGYQVICCSNGKEAVDCYEQSWREIDLVLLDMIMPVMGGREAFARMKKINPEILAILSSGYSVDGEAQTILDDGVKAFIRKPYQLLGLSEKVAQVLRKP